MKNSQRAGSQDDRAGTARMRGWWIGEKLSGRLFGVASGLVLAGALVWAGLWAAAPAGTAISAAPPAATRTAVTRPALGSARWRWEKGR